MKSVWKIIAALLVCWIGVSVAAVGVMSTGLTLTTMTFIVGVSALVIGTALTFFLLRREARFEMHLPLIVLVLFGAWVAYGVVMYLNRTH